MKLLSKALNLQLMKSQNSPSLSANVPIYVVGPKILKYEFRSIPFFLHLQPLLRRYVGYFWICCATFLLLIEVKGGVVGAEEMKRDGGIKREQKGLRKGVSEKLMNRKKET